MPGSPASRLRARHAAPQAPASSLPGASTSGRSCSRPPPAPASLGPSAARAAPAGHTGLVFPHGGPLEGFRGWVVHVLPPLRPAVLHLPGRQRSDPLTDLGQLVGRQHVVHDANARGPHSCGCCAIGERSCGQDRQASGQGSRWLERLAQLASPVQPDRHSRRGRAHGKAERVAPCARHGRGAAFPDRASTTPDRGVQSAAQFESAESQADTLQVCHRASHRHPPQAASPPALPLESRAARNNPPLAQWYQPARLLLGPARRSHRAE